MVYGLIKLKPNHDIYYCVICNAGPFYCYDKLVEHYKLSHPESIDDMKKWHCPECGAGLFDSYENLMKHYKTFHPEITTPSCCI